MASTNNALNNASTTDIANATQTFTISNSDNTGTSAASLAITVGGGGSSGDPKIVYSVTGSTNWAQGIDNSAADSYKIAVTDVLDSANVMIISTSGAMTRPLQPAFLAYPSGTLSNVTGNSVAYTIAFNTEVFDRNGNFASNTFTAPVTGIYFLCANAMYNNLGATPTSGELSIVTTNRTYTAGIINYGVVVDINANLIQEATYVCDVTAGDTATVRTTVNLGTQTVGLLGGTAPIYTQFSGYLIC
jgi:hypothetical protein